MNNAQKIIKYVAIVLALSLVVSIITSILTGILTICGISTIIDIANDNVETMNYLEEYTDVNSIIIDVAAVDLEILPSDKLKVEGTEIPVDYKFEKEADMFKIKGKKVKSNAKLIIHVPSNTTKFDIDIGAGNVKMNDISLQELDLDTGAAKTKIENLLVSSKTEIDAGVGEIEIINSDLSNLDLDAGIGNIKYAGYLRGANIVDCGVGNIKLDLVGGEHMYKIMAERGIGELKVNDNSLSGSQVIGTGLNTIKLSGGIGSLKVTY